jgi:leader peptidase (prepilin peptidase)/N-methyltransferase
VIYLFLFVLGAIVGSFLNVVALRWGTELTLGGRSFCPSCNRQLRWWELVPLVSYLLQRGKCRTCRAKISPQYLLVEILVGLIFTSLYYVVGLGGHFLLLATVFSIYTIILIYDLRHKIIPDSLSYTSTALALMVPLFFVSYSLVDWLAGPIIFAFFGSIWLFSRGRAMGFGDAKLGLSVGLLLGAANGFSAIILAFWIGAASSLFLMLSKRFTMKSEIPFAPFIIVGTWISIIFNLNILHVGQF